MQQVLRCLIISYQIFFDVQLTLFVIHISQVKDFWGKYFTEGG